MARANSNTQHEELRAEYKRRHDAVLIPLAEALRGFLVDCLKGEPRIDRMAVRAKVLIGLWQRLPSSKTAKRSTSSLWSKSRTNWRAHHHLLPY